MDYPVSFAGFISCGQDKHDLSVEADIGRFLCTYSSTAAGSHFLAILRMVNPYCAGHE